MMPAFEGARSPFRRVTISMRGDTGPFKRAEIFFWPLKKTAWVALQFSLLALLTATLSACGGGSQSQAPPPPPGISVSISPKQGGLTLSQTLIFTATVTGDSQNLGVTWSATGGSFSSNTSNPTTYSVSGAPAGVYTVTAMSNADNTKSVSAAIGVTNLAGIFSWRGMEGDTTRQGVNSKEYALTPANVSSATFGKLFSCSVDGYVFAQPLYIANLAISGKMHNVVYVATENDSLFAFDADTNAAPCTPLWQRSLLPAGETAVTATNVGNVGSGPLIGITGTPVIDPASGTLYVVAESVNAASAYFHRLYAINITTGANSVAPQVIAASVPGSGSGGNGTTLSFDPLRSHQRPGLLLLNGNVYIAWGSNDDAPIYHGWIMGYTASNLQQMAAISVTPDGSASHGLEGGVWMTGAAPSADSSGNIYISVGNGTFDDTTNAIPPVAPNDDFGDSALKLTNVLAISDFFTPFNQATLDADDEDLGSSGVVLLPDLTAPGVTHLMFCGGKDSKIYLMNRDNLGKFQAANGGVVQYFKLSGDNNGNGFRATPAFFNNTLYGAGDNDPLMAVNFDPGTRQFATTPSFKSNETYTYTGVSPSISAQGTANGIVWVIDYGHTNAILRAYDATNLAKLYDSSKQGSRDMAGPDMKFTVPTVANGKVYVGTQTELDVYGFLPN